MPNDAMKGDTPAPAPAVKPTPTDCEWCVGGMQADGETPCPCQEPANPLNDPRVLAMRRVLEIVADGDSKDYTDNCYLARAALSALEENK